MLIHFNNIVKHFIHNNHRIKYNFYILFDALNSSESLEILDVT